MKKIGIVTDSHSSISQEEAKKLGIFVLPMPFYIDGECYYESVTLSRELFFEKLTSGADISTSQPSPTAVTKHSKNMKRSCICRSAADSAVPTIRR